MTEFQTSWRLDRCLLPSRLTIDVRDTTGASAGAVVDPVANTGGTTYESRVSVPSDCFIGYALLVDTVTGDVLDIQSLNGRLGACAVRAVMTETGPGSPMATATANDGSIAGALKALMGTFTDTDANF